MLEPLLLAVAAVQDAAAAGEGRAGHRAGLRRGVRDGARQDEHGVHRLLHRRVRPQVDRHRRPGESTGSSVPSSRAHAVASPVAIARSLSTRCASRAHSLCPPHLRTYCGFHLQLLSRTAPVWQLAFTSFRFFT